MSDSLRHHGLNSPWNSLGQNPGVGSLSFLQRIFPTQDSHTVGDSLPAEPEGKPKNTEVGNLSLLQRIFPTQESNQSLLLCRQILYQLSYEEVDLFRAKHTLQTEWPISEAESGARGWDCQFI